MKVSEINTLIALSLEGNSVARDLLKNSIMNSKWGQSGCTFVTDTRYSFSCAGRVRTLLVNSRPVARVDYFYKEDASLKIYSPQEGERMYQEQKELVCQNYADQQAARAACIQDLERFGVDTPKNFGGWYFYPGQEGGTFHHPSWGYVSAPGALKGAQNVSHPVEREYDRALYGARF